MSVLESLSREKVTPPLSVETIVQEYHSSTKIEMEVEN